MESSPFKIELTSAAKQYYRQWIFRDMNLSFSHGESIAIVGPNGSGKSTLVASLMGYTPLTKGELTYTLGGAVLEPDDTFRYIALAAPYMELTEEFTLKELLSFHFKFKQPIGGMSQGDMIERMYLEDAKNKSIKYFSSGMKQRLKLGLAFFSESQALFLDEPTSNLDDKAKAWYHDQLGQVVGNRLVIIASNEAEEYAVCQQTVDLKDYQ